MNSIKPSVSSSLFTFLGGNLSSPFTSMFLSWSQDCIIEKVLEFRYRSIRQWQAKKAGCCTSFSAFFFSVVCVCSFQFSFPPQAAWTPRRPPFSSVLSGGSVRLPFFSAVFSFLFFSFPFNNLCSIFFRVLHGKMNKSFWSGFCIP